jgi:protein TonB
MPPEPVPPTRPTSPISSAQGVLIQQVPPKYPKLAKMAHISGPVTLQITVGTNGAVKNVNVISGHRLLRKAAIDAVQQWLYRPYMLNGKPTEVQTEVTVTFTLDEQ